MTIWGNDNRIRQKGVCVIIGLGSLEVCSYIVTTLVKDDFAFALSITSTSSTTREVSFTIFPIYIYSL
jgi:hypothetical protein